jgi:hypothetical protein
VSKSKISVFHAVFRLATAERYISSRDRTNIPPRLSNGAGPRYGDRDRNRDHNTGPKGRFVRPEQRRRPYDPKVQCDACKRVGHEALSCDMLAIALYLERYTKKELSDVDRSKIKQQWLGKWEEKLGRPACTPRQIMQTYCENFNVTPDAVDTAMDWDSWPDTEVSEDDYKLQLE